MKAEEQRSSRETRAACCVVEGRAGVATLADDPRDEHSM